MMHPLSGFLPSRACPQRVAPARPLLAALVALTLSACGSAPTPQWSPGEARVESYDTAYHQWTREGVHYNQLDAKATAYATYLSPSFMAALVDHQAEVEALTSSARQARRTAAVGEAEAKAQFMLSISTQEMQWDDLDLPNNTLRVVLLEGDKEVKYSELRRLGRREATVMRIYYPHFSPLTNAYVVTFPAPTNPKDVTLRIAGPPGHIDLRWKSR
ncbi:MAG: hypothetical protein ACE366_05260 [Bradymonadia bacterium]